MKNYLRPAYEGFFLRVGLAATLVCTACVQPAVEPLFDFASLDRVAFDAPESALEHTPVFEHIPGKVGSHAPSVVALADGTLLAAWYSYSGPGELEGSEIFTAKLAPGATQWSPPRRHTDGLGRGGNPSLHAERQSVLLFRSATPGGWSLSRVWVQSSTDGGETWSAPQAVPGPLGLNVRNAPVRLRSGALLVPGYDDLLQRSVFIVGDGAAWSQLSSIGVLAGDCIQPAVVERQDGTLLALMRNNAGRFLWVCTSNDQGATWSPPAHSGLQNPGAPVAVTRLKSGRLLLALNPEPSSRSTLAVTTSDDDGQQWRPLCMIRQGPGAYAYPSICQAPDSSIHLLYSDDRQRITHVRFSESWLLE